MSVNKLEQSPKIAVQIIKALESHPGTINLTFNMNATQYGVSNDQNSVTENPVAGSMPGQRFREADLLGLIDSFPPPKIKNFINYIYFISNKKFGGDKANAAYWLGVNPRTLYRCGSIRENKDGPIDAPLEIGNEIDSSLADIPDEDPKGLIALNDAPSHRMVKDVESGRRFKYVVNKDALINTLLKNKWGVSKTARDLGIPETAIRHRIMVWGIKKGDYDTLDKGGIR